jgi:Domain of unknown function (DUF4386)
MTTHDFAGSVVEPRSRGRGMPGLGPGSGFVSARVAGVLYVVIIAFGIFAEVVVRSRLIVDGDARETATNITDSEALFRLGFAADLVVFLCDVALAVILYFVFRPVSRTLSLLAAAFRLTQTAIIGFNLLNMFAALLILTDADYLGAFDDRQSESLSLFMLDLHAYGYTLGLTFFGVSTVIVGYLVLSSGCMPRLLGAALCLAGIGYVLDSAAFFLVAGYDGSISPILLAPALVGEVWFAVWLLLRGRRLDSLSEAPVPREAAS